MRVPFSSTSWDFATLFDPDLFSHFTHTGVIAGNLIATLTLAMLVLISVALVALTIIVPLRPTVRDAGWQLAVGGTVYFALIGSGFMMVEIALLQRMSVFLGHPVYALSVVLFSLILWTGFGSMASERVPLASAGELVAWSVASAAYLFVLPFWLPLLLVNLDGADLLVRAGFCVLVLAPAGFLMGFGFPTGMRLVSAISIAPTPWFWGINGRRSRRERCRCHQHCLQHRHDTQDRSRLLFPDRGSRRVVAIRGARDPGTQFYDPGTQARPRMCTDANLDLKMTVPTPDEIETAI
jgi:hypothetical protein